MAKKPAATSAPSQPWAKTGTPAPASAGIPPVADKAPVNAPAPSGDVPSEAIDQMTPAGDGPATVDTKAEALTADDTADRVQSEAKDQVTPVGPNPSEVDAAAEALTSDAAPERVQAEAKDQITPIGEDVSSTLHDAFASMDDDERAEFQADVEAAATKAAERIRRNREARALELNMVDSQQHYGRRAVAAKQE